MLPTGSTRSPFAIPAVALTIAAALFLARRDAEPASTQAVAADGVAAQEEAAGAPSPEGRPAAAPAAAGAAEPPPCPLGDGSCGGPARPGAKGGAAVPTPASPGAPQLLEFEAAYCAACATMAPVVTSIVKSCSKASEVVRRVDVAKDEGEALAQHYKVESLPTFLAVDAEGHEVFRRVGVQKPAELASLVAEVSGEDCTSVLR